MSDDLTTDDEQVEEIVEEEKKPARSDNRFKDLSDKVEITAKERDEAKALAESATKEMEFYKGFSKIGSKFQDANDYQDKIKEKVLAGSDLEEATVAVLYKAGKLNNIPAPSPKISPAGGSATNAMSNTGDKPINEMTRDEKREALLEVERESGGISQMLRRGIV